MDKSKITCLKQHFGQVWQWDKKTKGRVFQSKGLWFLLMWWPPRETLPLYNNYNVPKKIVGSNILPKRKKEKITLLDLGGFRVWFHGSPI